jgi:hypothetical protein
MRRGATQRVGRTVAHYPVAARRKRTISHASRPASAAIAISLSPLLRCLIADILWLDFLMPFSFLKHKCQNSNHKVDAGCDYECYTDRDSDFPGDFGPVHKSSRMPLKNG